MGVGRSCVGQNVENMNLHKNDKNFPFLQQKFSFFKWFFQTISIDSNDRFWKITFIVVGVNISINLVNPDQVVQTTIVLDYQLGDTWVYRFNGLEMGTWTFSVVSAAANTGC